MRGGAAGKERSECGAGAGRCAGGCGCTVSGAAIGADGGTPNARNHASRLATDGATESDAVRFASACKTVGGDLADGAAPVAAVDIGGGSGKRATRRMTSGAGQL